MPHESPSTFSVAPMPSPSPVNTAGKSSASLGRLHKAAGTPDKNSNGTKGPHSDETAKWRTAFSTASSISDPTKRQAALVRLCYERAESDPREALELAIEYGIEESPGVVANLAQQWAAVDLPSARAWAESQAEGQMREDLLSRIGYVWSLSDPAAAANFVTTSTSPGEVQTEAAISILHQWSGQDPRAARAWVECFPEGPLRERALHEVDGPQADPHGE